MPRSHFATWLAATGWPSRPASLRENSTWVSRNFARANRSASPLVDGVLGERFLLVMVENMLLACRNMPRVV